MKTALALMILLATVVWAQTTGRIEGRVVSTTGEPVRKATVRVQVMNGPPSGYVEVSAADGSFAIAEAAPGRYAVTAEKPGFAPPRLAVLLTVTAGKTERVEVKMPALGVIAGRVVDEDGDPAPSVTVTVMRYRWQGANRVVQRGSSAVADDRGEFRLTNLEPDRYYVLAEDKRTIAGALAQGNFVGAAARMVALPTYYPGELGVARAQAVEVKGGMEAAGIVIRQRHGETYTVRGRSIDGLTGASVTGAVQAILRDNPNQLRSSSGARQADGSFEIRGLQAGDYVLRLSTTDTNGQRKQVTGITEVTVTGNIDGVTVRVYPNFEVTGRLTVEDGELAELFPNGTAPRRPAISLLSSGPAGMGGGVTSQFAEDGTFRYPNVAPGLYSITMPALPGVYVKSVRVGGAELIGAALNLMQSVAGPIEIVLAKDAARVLLLPQPPDDGVRRQSVAWPKQPRGAMNNSGVATPAHGALLAPGDYYLAVFEDTDLQFTQSYGFLSLFNGLAAEVTLKAGETAMAEPVFIPKAKVDEVLGGLP